MFLAKYAATAHDQQPQHRREREVREREEHLPMLPESRLPGLEKRNPGFETPQARNKHAQASQIEVSLASRNASLVLSIRDDGVGGAYLGRGSGLGGVQGPGG